MGKSSGEAAAFSHPHIMRYRVIPNVVRNLIVITNYLISIIEVEMTGVCTGKAVWRKLAAQPPILSILSIYQILKLFLPSQAAEPSGGEIYFILATKTQRHKGSRKYILLFHNSNCFITNL